MANIILADLSHVLINMKHFMSVCLYAHKHHFAHLCKGKCFPMQVPTLLSAIFSGTTFCMNIIQVHKNFYTDIL